MELLMDRPKLWIGAVHYLIYGLSNHLYTQRCYLYVDCR